MTDRGTMREVSHTPADDVGVDAWFRRGRRTATDGGERPEEDRTKTEGRAETEDRDATTERMADVSHSHDDHADAHSEMWSRGANDRKSTNDGGKVPRDVDGEEDHE